MRVAIVFDTPYPDWTPQDYLDRMEVELSEDYEGEADAEYQVAGALLAKGHEVVMVGAHQTPDEVTDVLYENPPDVVFNLAEGFGSLDRFDFILPAVLELEGYAYTGAGPQALIVTRNKAMQKKILGHHGLCVPRFLVVRHGEKVPRKADDLFFPAIVKPLRLDSSEGISQASVVYDRDQLVTRVAFIHERLKDAAIVEQYIDGREMYAAVLGNGRQAKMLPPLELVFDESLTRPEQRIVTKNAKWSDEYCEERGISLHFANELSDRAAANLKKTCLTAYRALWLRDYARFDIRLDDEDRPWVLEANANPYISEGHEAAESARKAGMSYPDFIERICKIAIRRHRRDKRRNRR
jgi:D-alanine-D-alanine ligase